MQPGHSCRWLEVTNAASWTCCRVRCLIGISFSLNQTACYTLLRSCQRPAPACYLLYCTLGHCISRPTSDRRNLPRKPKTISAAMLKLMEATMHVNGLAWCQSNSALVPEQACMSTLYYAKCAMVSSMHFSRFLFMAAVGKVRRQASRYC